MKNKIILGILLSVIAINVSAYNLTQVTIKHVQVGNGDRMYISIDADTDGVTGCSESNGWLIMKFDDPAVANIYREILSLAMAAYVSKTPVDVGGPNGCVSGYSNMTFIRLGNYR